MPEPQEIEIDGEVKKFYSAEDVEAMQKEMEEKLAASQPSDNFKAMRDKLDILEKEKEDYAKKLEEAQKQKEPNEPLTPEQIEERVSAKIRMDMVNDALTERLANYDEEEAKLVKHFYDKLATGEQVTVKNIDQFIQQAEKLALPDKPKFNPLTYGAGGVPEKGSKPTFADSDEGKGLASMMGLSFPSVKE